MNAVNGCDSIVTYTIILSVDPTLTVDIETELGTSHCAGTPVIETGIGYTVTNAVEAGWRMIGANDVPAVSTYKTAGVEFVPTAALTYDMNGKQVYAYVANGCDTLISRVYTLNVTDIPMLADTDKTLANDTICLGEVAEFNVECIDAIVWNGSNGTTSVEYTVNGGRTWQVVDPTTALRPTLTDTFQIRVVAANACDTIVVDGPVTITVNDTVKLAATNLVQKICLGSEIAPIALNYAFSTISVDTLCPGDFRLSVCQFLLQVGN